MPRDKAIEAIKKATEKTYARKGKDVVKKNFAAIDNALENLHEVRIPEKAAGRRDAPDADSRHRRPSSCATSRRPSWRCAATRCR